MALPLMAVERAAIVGALIEHQGDRDVAARVLGIGRTTLYRKMHDLLIAEGEYMGEGAIEKQQQGLDDFHHQLMDGFVRELELRHTMQLAQMKREHLDILQQISRLIAAAHLV